MRPAALTALQGADLIIHAGDVGRPEVLDQLASLLQRMWYAAISTCRAGRRTFRRRWTSTCTACASTCFMTFRRWMSSRSPGGIAGVVFGHSHKPFIETRDGVLYLNPGSAGPRRFRLPVTIARVRVSGRTTGAGDCNAGVVTSPVCACASHTVCLRNRAAIKRRSHHQTMARCAETRRTLLRPRADRASYPLRLEGRKR